MSSYTRFIPPIYNDWENTEISNFNFLLIMEIQRNFCKCNPAISNCHTCDKQMPKRPVIENNHTLKLNMACVCDRTP